MSTTRSAHLELHRAREPVTSEHAGHPWQDGETPVDRETWSLWSAYHTKTLDRAATDGASRRIQRAAPAHCAPRRTTRRKREKTK